MGMVSKFNWVPCLFGFFLAIAYIPGIFGAAIMTGWLYLFITIPFWVFFVQADLKNTHIYGLLFLVYAFLSLLWTFNLSIAYFFLLQLFVLAAVFYVGSTVKDLKPIVIGLTVGLGVSDLVGIGQYLGYNQVFSITNVVAGLFVNRNIFCEASVVILLCLVALKLWYWIPLTLPAIIHIHSRAAILGLFIGITVWGWKRNKLYTVISASALLFVGLAYYRNSDILSINERYQVWADTFRGLSILGNGIGTYEVLYPLFAINIDTYITRPKFAHNDLLQLAFEFGVGITFLILMALNVLKVKDRDESIILYGIGTISMFAYPFHVPMLAFIGLLVAGYLTRFDGANWLLWNTSRPVLSK